MSGKRKNPEEAALFFLPSNGKHAGKEIAELFKNAFAEHDLNEKIAGITVDNASANTTFMRELSHLIPNFDCIDQHFRCYAHVLNLSVQDMLKVLKIDSIKNIEGKDDFEDNEDAEEEARKEIIEEDDENATDETNLEFPLFRLRKLFNILKYSEQCKEKLTRCCDIVEERMLQPSMDVSTRWNSTYDMIATGTKMQRAISLLCQNNLKLRKYFLSEYDWELLKNVNEYLVHFKILSQALSGEKYITLPLVVIGLNMLVDRIEESIKELIEKMDQSEIDAVIVKALKAARAKLMKHYEKSN
ncbi:uncharacterized protein LOC122506311 [Leptopilina heterotoma]|uniref:uncharacterized protein LOC122506311 n=1 Tax=Leptopilina heterotoma TaxID=63436 RepID=UPI001CA9BCBF|nr:uncharacterized protein LOC122506311 [Leptopilina heterotoma]